MLRKEMIAMLLAGGQGSRLGVLTNHVAKPAVSFGGKYRIIDFPLSNCVNSGVDTVGVLTQYQPLLLNSHIGIGIPWDLDKNYGGVTILSPHETIEGSDWYSGTANAIFQNLDFIDMYDPEYVLILSGDHIYKMDYDEMLRFHKESGADATVAVRTVPWEEASRFGLVIADETGRVSDFEEKPADPRSNLASMGIYIFSWKVLKRVLIELKNQPNCDFGMHVMPYLKDNGSRLYAYRFDEYWKDVGTLSSYWQANMELIDIVPEFNLYEDFWRIYTRCDNVRPQYIGANADVKRSLISEASDIYGCLYNSIIGFGVTIEEGAIVEDSIIMSGSVIKKGAHLRKTIVAENCIIGENVETGVFEYAESVYDKKVYQSDLVTIGEKSVIPDNVKIGKNTAIIGRTTIEDYQDGALLSGHVIIREDGAL